MSIKQVTVFGASGFVGRAVVRALARQGYLIKAACRRTEPAEAVRTAGDVGQIMLVRANLRIPASVSHAIAGSQAVVRWQASQSEPAGVGGCRGGLPTLKTLLWHEAQVPNTAS